MLQSRAEWEALQKRLPPEDRESYESYLQSQGYPNISQSKLAALEKGVADNTQDRTTTVAQTIPLDELEAQAEAASAKAEDTAADARQAKLDSLEKLTLAKQLEAKARVAAKAAARKKLLEDAQKAREEAAKLKKEAEKLAKEAEYAKTQAAVAEAEAKVAAERKAKEDIDAARIAEESATRATAEAAAAKEAADKAAATAEANVKAAAEAAANAKTEEEKTAAADALKKAEEEKTAAASAQEAATAAVDAAKTETESAVAVTSTTPGATSTLTPTSTTPETPVTTLETPVTTPVTTVTTPVTTATTTTTAATTVTTTPTVVDTQLIGTGTNRVIRTYYKDGTYIDTPSPDTAFTSGTTDAATITALQALQAQNAALLAQMQAASKQASMDAAAAAEAAAKEKRESAITVLTDRFTRYGLASLIPKIKQLAIDGASESTITLQLQESEEYKQRFIANQDRIKKGLSVLDPGEYLGLEDRYRQILRAYGLKQFDNDSYVTQFLANDVSPEELSSRVVNAVQRVQNADPAVSAMLRQYYNIGMTDMVAYVLDPNNQLPKVERQIGAAEIGVAAARQGLTAGVTVAEQLAAQGINQAEAQKGYATIADILPQATKLSDIYSGVLDQYNQAEAEQEVFNSLASAQRKRRALTEREIAAFSGSAGLSGSSLTKQIGGKI